MASVPQGYRRVGLAPVAFQPTGLTIAVTVSIALHLVLFAVRFVLPQPMLVKPPQSALEVVLVNARSADRPVKADALAQADLNGGGNDESGRATSFVARSAEASDGEALRPVERAPASAEDAQRRLLVRDGAATTSIAPEAPPRVEMPDVTASPEVNTSVKAIARLEAQIDRETRDYNARPRRGFIGPTTRGVSYAMYYSQWKDKVERIGTVNYPEEARGRIYGDLVLRVTLNPDGTIYNDEVQITQSSGSPVLDRAAKRIVRLAAPYGRFPADLRGEFDVFEIYSTFRFTRGNALEMHTLRP